MFVYIFIFLYEIILYFQNYCIYTTPLYLSTVQQIIHNSYTYESLDS